MSEPTRRIEFFDPPQRPTGGTAYQRPQVAPVTYFDPPQRPNGGTVYVKPSDSGNPYANAEETQEVVVVELPEYEVKE